MLYLIPLSASPFAPPKLLPSSASDPASPKASFHLASCASQISQLSHLLVWPLSKTGACTDHPAMPESNPEDKAIRDNDVTEPKTEVSQNDDEIEEEKLTPEEEAVS